MAYIETLGAYEYDNLIAGNTIPTHTATGTIASGQGKLTRGTVLALSTGTSGTGKLVILGTTAGSNETLTAYGILCDEVDATSADAVGEIYVTGQFNTERLIVKESYSMTTADVQALRDGGIYIENAVTLIDPDAED
nr:MAG TPA: Head decoration protein [Caudoviricetes sp.]